MPGKQRIIVAKPGLDGHDRGAQEDADAVGLSCHSGAHMTLFPRVVSLLREKGAGDVVIFGGGIIPKDDIPRLAEAGIEKIFTPGATTGEIVEWLHQRLPQGA